MKAFIGSLYFLLIITACNNREEKAAEIAAADTASLKDSAVIAEMVTAPGFEDSVFADGSIPTSWENAGIDNPKGMVDFIKTFQGWVALDQKDSIAAHIRYPTAEVKSKEQFAKKYTEIFTPDYKAAIAKQNTRQIFRNMNGAMIADGKVWFIQGADGFYITAINK